MKPFEFDPYASLERASAAIPSHSSYSSFSGGRGVGADRGRPCRRCERDRPARGDCHNAKGDTMSKIDKPGKRKIGFERTHENAVKADVPDLQTRLHLFGTGDRRLASELLSQLVFCAGVQDTARAKSDRDFGVAILEDFAPRDAVERLLAVQMAATHAATMRAAAMLADAERDRAIKTFSNGFNRLARTSAAQAEQFRRHRNGGQSNVTVEHVAVNEGGQAIVGNIEKS